MQIPVNFGWKFRQILSQYSPHSHTTNANYAATQVMMRFEWDEECKAWWMLYCEDAKFHMHFGTFLHFDCRSSLGSAAIIGRETKSTRSCGTFCIFITRRPNNPRREIYCRNMNPDLNPVQLSGCGDRVNCCGLISSFQRLLLVFNDRIAFKLNAQEVELIPSSPLISSDVTTATLIRCCCELCLQQTSEACS